MNLLIHPVANLFPMLSDAEALQLREDIRVHGLREPVWGWHDRANDKRYLIDGRNRTLQCRELGIEPEVRWWDEKGSLVEFVMSLNFHRRMLTASQRAYVAAKALPMLEEEARKRQEASRAKSGEQIGKAPVNLPAPMKGDARDHAAKLANVSGKSVSDAKKVLEKCHPDVAKAVESGQASASDAKRIANLPPEKQLEALRKVEAKAARTLAAAVAEDTREENLRTGQKALRKARVAFTDFGSEASGVVKLIDQALEKAMNLEAKPAKGKAASKGKPEAELPLWLFEVPGYGSQEVRANTKGEARAKVKKQLGLTRLPPGTTGKRVSSSADEKEAA